MLCPKNVITNALQSLYYWYYLISILDVRVHYVSKVENEDTLFFDPTASFSRDSTWMTTKNQKKKATLSAWINLQSIPEETIITPNILEFLEQALQPIPTFNIKDSNPDQDTFANNEDNFEGEYIASLQQTKKTEIFLMTILFS